MYSPPQFFIKKRNESETWHKKITSMRGIWNINNNIIMVVVLENQSRIVDCWKNVDFIIYVSSKCMVD